MNAPSLPLLIVDDSLVMRNRLARLAADPRMPPLAVVGMARDGAEAVELARRTSPAVITMDLTMPNMDGAACIEAIAGFLPSARILVVSALSDKATALKAIKKGAHGFIHKPFADADLVAAIEELLR